MKNPVPDFAAAHTPQEPLLACGYVLLDYKKIHFAGAGAGSFYLREKTPADPEACFFELSDGGMIKTYGTLKEVDQLFTRHFVKNRSHINQSYKYIPGSNFLLLADPSAVEIIRATEKQSRWYVELSFSPSRFRPDLFTKIFMNDDHTVVIVPPEENARSECQNTAERLAEGAHIGFKGIDKSLYALPEAFREKPPTLSGKNIVMHVNLVSGSCSTNLREEISFDSRAKAKAALQNFEQNLQNAGPAVVL